MDDLSEKLAGILNDPQSMEQVKQLAENIFSGENANESSQNNDFGNMPSGEELGAIMSIMSKLNSKQDDERTKLLTCLKPYLSEKKQEKADNAIKILKLLELLPLIKDSGLFKL